MLRSGYGFGGDLNACVGEVLRDDASMTAKEILLKVAEILPTNATLLDAINELEMYVGTEDKAEITRSLREDAVAVKPEWLYESPSRLRTALKQTCRSAFPVARSFCE